MTRHAPLLIRPLERPSGFARRHSGRCRTGSVLIAALVCMLVVMAMVGAMLQIALRARKQIRVERGLRQTELLLQAGADRAAIRLSREDDYRGESWKIPADALTGQDDGQVTIEASRDSKTVPWRVQVVAEYPFGSEHSIHRSIDFHVPSQKPHE